MGKGLIVFWGCLVGCGFEMQRATGQGTRLLLLTRAGAFDETGAADASLSHRITLSPPLQQICQYSR